jgi:methylthioribose-1-phosphate isomerase
MPLPAWSHISWLPGGGVRILDQTRLPTEEIYLDLTTIDAMAEAIRLLRVRGAPLIGIAGAMGLTLGGQGGGGAGGQAGGRTETLAGLRRDAAVLRATRPTAVNLAWALDRVLRCAESVIGDADAIRAAVRAEADAIWVEDRAMCDRIGEAGLPLVPDGATIYTHCNAGALATGGRGTALSPVYTAHERGRRVQVIADETRPLLQGSRLTAWELGKAGISCTVLADGMAASRLRRGGVTAVMVGADRIAANGDTANKIGTYGLALAARAHGVPFYIAAPSSTFDPATSNGAAIPIEERDPQELMSLAGIATAPVTAAVWNPAFDVTPVELITGFITDRGLLAPADLGGWLKA